MERKQVRSLGEVSGDRNNNLNLLRFLAASMVVLGHSYVLGNGSGDPLGWVTGWQMGMGYLGVSIFFFFGGFLICGSMCRVQKARPFFRARAMRIFPCLAVVVFASAFLLGPMVTEIGIAEYFTSAQTYKYLCNALLLPVHNLPGVFTENVGGAAVNGALWTLPVEFVCYIACFLLFCLGLLKEKPLKFTIPFFIVGYAVLWRLTGDMLVLQNAIRPCGMFYVGMLYYTYREKIPMRASWALLCLAGIVLSLMLHIQEATVLLFLPYLLAYLVFGMDRKASGFGRRMEISYGLYLCAFPIQQTVTMLFGGTMLPLINFAISWPLAVVFGILLYWGVEKQIGKI